MSAGDGDRDVMGSGRDELDALLSGDAAGAEPSEARLRELVGELQTEFSEPSDVARAEEYAALAAWLTADLRAADESRERARAGTGLVQTVVDAWASTFLKVSLGVAAVVLALGVVGAADRLPRPVQSVVADTAGFVGIDLPHPDDSTPSTVPTEPGGGTVGDDDGSDDRSGGESEEQRRLDDLQEEAEDAEEERRKAEARAERDRLRAEEEAEEERLEAEEDQPNELEDADSSGSSDSDSSDDDSSGSDSSGSGSSDDD